MSHHFFLPQLTDENLSTPSEYGHWFNNDKKIIIGISDAIHVDENALIKGVSSIPDIWARPLIFQSAIKQNSNHPLKKRCIQEWRGLMSLLALHKIFPDLSALEIEPIELNSETLSTALKNLSPSSVQLEKGKFYEWKHILMIKFDGIPIGAFSPSTLVFTGADYNYKLINRAFPLKDEFGYLSPPKTKKEGIENIGEWLLHIQYQLNSFFYSAQTNSDHQVIGNINYLIDDWLNDIRKELGLSPTEIINARRYKVSDDIIDIKRPAGFLSGYNVYKALLQPLIIDSESKLEHSISDVAIASTRVLKDFKNVIVIHEKLLEDDIYLWEEIRSKPLGENPREIINKYFTSASGTKIGNVDIGDRGSFWIRPELYFLSDELLKAKQGEMLMDQEGDLNIGTKYILPFRNELLKYFSSIEIKELLNPTYKDDGDVVKFSFTLPLIGNKKLKVEKIYRTKGSQPGEGIISLSEAPIIEIFPDYMGENWRKYYFLQGMAEVFNIRPLFESTNNLIFVRDRESSSSEHYQKIRLTEITGDNAFPEGIEIKNDKNIAIGVILISKPNRQHGLKDKWTIGIDFGTSNTNVYKKTGYDDPASRWCYNFPEYYRSITYSDRKSRDFILTEHFFPIKKINLPIPTTLRIFSPKKQRMLLDYFIYYPIEYKFPEDVLSDIKWNGDGERNTEFFLEGILFLLLIEIVRYNIREVQLACSYPKAFSDTNIIVFKEEWNRVLNKSLVNSNENMYNVLSSHSNKVLRLPNDNDEKSEDNEIKIKFYEPIYRTEGIAAGEYFASPLTIDKFEDRANKAIAAICLDVGGGTTDISIWYYDKIEFDSSILLAGRQISNLLQRNSRVRELLFSKEAAIALEEKKNESAYFSARLNLILKNEEPRIHDMLIKHANNKDIQWLRQILALEFGALCFYAAQVCVSTNKKVGGLLSRIADAGINLHWGGNAAKLINWIDFGKYNREGIASKLLNAIFYNCLNDKSLAEHATKAKEIGQRQSPGHKSEASGGLVVMELNPNDVSTIGRLSSIQDDDYEMPDLGSDKHKFYTGIVCGENIVLTDKSVSFYETISNNDLFDTNGRTKFESTSLERLMRFIEVLNFFGIKNGLFTDDTKISLNDSEKRLIRDGVATEFIRMQSQKESHRLIEPIFITEIKLLMEIIRSKMN